MVEIKSHTMRKQHKHSPGCPPIKPHKLAPHISTASGKSLPPPVYLSFVQFCINIFVAMENVANLCMQWPHMVRLITRNQATENHNVKNNQQITYILNIVSLYSKLRTAYHQHPVPYTRKLQNVKPYKLSWYIVRSFRKQIICA